MRILIAALALLATLAATAAAEPFAIARVHYDGGGDWYGDPTSLANLQRYLEETLGIETAEREKVVRLMDEDLFRYPYLYLTGHGNIRFSKEETGRLRDYLLGGGFMHVDDNYGLDESFRREISKVFPEEELVELPYDHPIYHMVFPFPDGPPKIHKHDGEPAQGYAIVIDGRVVLYYTYQTDLGDGWEDADVHNVPAAKREAALQMGVNIIAYALSGQPERLP